jgi:hypothetical protein
MKILVSINKVNYKSDTNTTLSYTLSIIEKANDLINLSSVCYDVDETQTIRYENQIKKIKITRTKIYSKQSIKELSSTCSNLSSTTTACFTL